MRLAYAAASAALAIAATLVSVNSAAAEESAYPCRDAPDKPVVTGAVFSDPTGSDRTAVVRQICDLVHQTPSGERIQIAHFVISGAAGMDFATELIAAHRRGVDVQIVIDGWQVDNPAMAALQDELGADESDRSWVHVCSNLSPEGNTSSCIGTKGQHNKFYLFSRTGGASDVVVQSSANFTDLNSQTYWNNALTIVGNERLHQAYQSYFEDLAAEKRNDDYYRSTVTGMPGGTVTSYFFPRATGDTIAESLVDVNCDNGGAIRIGMSEWDAYRIGIAERLVELADQGCAVSVVHGKLEASVRERLRANPAIELRQLNFDALPGRIHSKYMLIEAEYAGDADARWTFTGSPNFNRTSLRRNDEAMLKTNLSKVYDQYRDNFSVMWAAAQPTS